jgi:protein-L-isoaspartate(D-aspartate) O-methyltransferase
LYRDERWRYRLDMRRLVLTAVCILITLSASAVSQTRPQPEAIDLEDYPTMRALLMESIQAHTRASAPMTGIEAIDPAIMAVMAEIPRHEFVPAELRKLAYFDVPLPLGYGQKLSQPFLTALMTHLAEVGKDDVVFETGTDSGYQAAILSHLASKVYSVEVVEPLAEAAAERLGRLGYEKVEVKSGDGYYGWSEKGPFDVIIVKEALHHIPPPLLNQLKPGGRMVIPVGPLDQSQILKLVTKGQDGRINEQSILPVRFAPLQGGERI